MLSKKLEKISQNPNSIIGKYYRKVSDKLIEIMLGDRYLNQKIINNLQTNNDKSNTNKTLTETFYRSAAQIIELLEINSDLDKKELNRMIAQKIQCNFWKIDYQISNCILDLTLSFLKNPDSLFSDDIGVCTIEYLTQFMKIIGFHELSFYLKVSDKGPGIYYKKSISQNREIIVTHEIVPDSSKCTNQDIDCNFHRLTTGKFTTSKGGMQYSNVGMPGVGEDFTAAINNNLLFAGDDFTDARNIDKIIHIFELLRLNFKMIGEIKFLSEKAERDTLTGLFNREKLNNKNFRKGFVLFIDFDDFKNINETYGHFIGDKTLRSVAKVMLDSIREKDLDYAFRYGGDEFVIYLNIECAKQAKNVAERIINTIANTPIFIESDHSIKETISMGCQRIDFSAGLGFHDAIKIADKNLKKAKQNGKNCLIFNDKVEGIYSPN